MLVARQCSSRCSTTTKTRVEASTSAAASASQRPPSSAASLAPSAGFTSTTLSTTVTTGSGSEFEVERLLVLLNHSDGLLGQLLSELLYCRLVDTVEDDDGINLVKSGLELVGVDHFRYN